jgi:hypothetical protein
MRGVAAKDVDPSIIKSPREAPPSLDAGGWLIAASAVAALFERRVGGFDGPPRMFDAW